MISSPGAIIARFAGHVAALAKLGHQRGILRVEGFVASGWRRIGSTEGSWTTKSVGRAEAIWVTTSRRTIASHVARIAADATNNIGRVVPLLGTIVLAVSNPTTILANLVLIIAQRPIQSGEFA